MTDNARRDVINAAVVLVTLLVSVLSALAGFSVESGQTGNPEQALGGLLSGALVFACVASAFVLLLRKRVATICPPALIVVTAFALPASMLAISLPGLIASVASG